LKGFLRLTRVKYVVKQLELLRSVKLQTAKNCGGQNRNLVKISNLSLERLDRVLEWEKWYCTVALFYSVR
jgi:hypothetical protein